MILITGGAGFIGSNLVVALNERGVTDIVICDRLGTQGKWKNLAGSQFDDLIHPSDLTKWLTNRAPRAVIHLGAISSTLETDGDRILATNYQLSKDLLDLCIYRGARFIYASSAATYGDGSLGFDDNLSDLPFLRPTTLYAWSKHLFDLHVRSRGHLLPPQCAGLKFFNVFGPNEYHKGEMRSVVAKAFEAAMAGRAVTLFKSDADILRDFIYVDDVVDVILWFLDNPSRSGLFNVGTGIPHTFEDLLRPVFESLGGGGVRGRIEYIPIPDHVRPGYQFRTQANINLLRNAGYFKSFTPLDVAVRTYVMDYLADRDKYRRRGEGKRGRSEEATRERLTG
jgi:ADP-L-glycero-D-manno-heptose 6-epimerase